jgi:DNA-binding response OmpR family regulator
VRALLIAARGRELPFVEDLVASFAEPVTTATEESEVQSLVATNDLLVIARDAWTDEDTRLCGRLYAARLGVPLLGVTASCSREAKTAALRAGADEFMSIPFEAEELVVRAFTLLRRASSGPGQARAGLFLVNFGVRQVFVDGRSIALTLREFDVLAALIEHTGKVVTREELAARTASNAARESNIIDVHVSRLRDKLGAHASAIETVRGIGYRFRAP